MPRRREPLWRLLEAPAPAHVVKLCQPRQVHSERSLAVLPANLGESRRISANSLTLVFFFSAPNQLDWHAPACTHPNQPDWHAPASARRLASLASSPAHPWPAAPSPSVSSQTHSSPGRLLAVTSLLPATRRQSRMCSRAASWCCCTCQRAAARRRSRHSRHSCAACSSCSSARPKGRAQTTELPWRSPSSTSLRSAQILRRQRRRWTPRARLPPSPRASGSPWLARSRS
mmetsp:Transcript_40327/g.129627  ORF Transcript_40327/g.129627 Transcript_40327/m.129627 type:complete len:230 (+) Transcript_40327:186-875(+)